MELYLDNFRGFEKQYIELNDVNFLVGENSTGKTTLLGLLSLFSGHDRIWDTDFKNEFVDFGSFSDIVSKDKRAKNHFLIGFLNTENLNFPFGEMLLKYTERNGFPMLSQISIKKDNYIAIICPTDTKTSLSFYKSGVETSEWATNHVANDNMVFSKEIRLPKELSTELNFLLMGSNYEKKEERRIVKKFDDFYFGNNLQIKLEEEIFWIDPVRTKPRRIYEPQKLKYSAEGEHTPTLLRDILTNNTAKQNKVFIAALEDFGKASGLFDEVKVDQYRKSKDAPFSLLFKLKNKEMKISNVGYGISQVLPILTEVLYAPKGSTFLIQQPEVHLHPRSQAYFGEFVYNQLVEQKKKFVIETHSDYLIDRYRLQVRKRNGQVYKKTNILFFETDGVKNKVTKIAIDKNGDYVGEQPQKFREFFLKEEMELLGL